MAPLVVDGFVPGVLSDSEVVFSDLSCWRSLRGWFLQVDLSSVRKYLIIKKYETSSSYVLDAQTIKDSDLRVSSE